MALIGVAALALALWRVLAPGGASTQDAAPSASGAVGQTGTRLVAKRLPVPLQAPVSGEAVAPDGKRLLVLGGLDAAGASASGVFSVDPGTGRLVPAGSLAQPVHDAAAATLGGTAYLFGGGDTSSTTAVQAIDAGGTARVVGHLPAPRSDLVAATVGGQIYLIGGYDGRTLSAAVLRTRDGRTFSTAARLPVPVRYPAVAAGGGKIYVFGGETANGVATRSDPGDRHHQWQRLGRRPAAQSARARLRHRARRPDLPPRRNDRERAQRLRAPLRPLG